MLETRKGGCNATVNGDQMIGGKMIMGIGDVNCWS